MTCSSIRFGLESTSDYQGDNISLPSKQNMEVEDRQHRVKRGGVYGGVGKGLAKFGPKFKKMCLYPLVGPVLCPLIKPTGKLYIKIGLAAKKFGKTAKKKAPKLPVFALKQAKTANPVTATKNVIKNAPKVVKFSKFVG